MTQFGQGGGIAFIKRTGFVGFGGFDVAGPVSLPAIAVQGELTDHERFPVHGIQSQIHLPVGILENAQSRRLAGQKIGVGRSITAPDADKNQDAAGNAGHLMAIHLHPGAPHPLNHQFHRNYSGEFMMRSVLSRLNAAAIS